MKEGSIALSSCRTKKSPSSKKVSYSFATGYTPANQSKKKRKMASISASISTSTPSLSLIQKPTIASPILGLPSMSKMGKVRCSMEGKPAVTSDEAASKLRMGMSSLMAAAMAATVSSPAAMALVDERMSTEGTGLPFGLSNNLLGWILFGVFGLLLKPNGSPVPSVLILSSTRAIAAGLDTVAATAAAINEDAPIPNFDAAELSDVTAGLLSMEHLTFPILLIDGNPDQY
ncbi:hypothetical protein SSX86_022193 [Deinandra increscens subsp. villosa]|uniref:PSII 6.1 kDa protein n=1 Tax=Deinandra increscens subsp. villosa TaxID=3103831 RepID=A0AAP0GNV3_9ASTR